MSTSSARIEGSDRSAGPYDEPIDILKNDGFAPLASAGFPLQFAQYALAAIETAAVIASAFLAKAVYLDYLVGTNTPFETFFAIAACMSCTIYVFFHQMGLYSVESLTGPQIGVSKIIGGIAISFLTVLGLLYALKEIGDLSRGWVGVWFAIIWPHFPDPLSPRGITSVVAAAVTVFGGSAILGRMLRSISWT